MNKWEGQYIGIDEYDQCKKIYSVLCILIGISSEIQYFSEPMMM